MGDRIALERERIRRRLLDFVCVSLTAPRRHASPPKRGCSAVSYPPQTSLLHTRKVYACFYGLFRNMRGWLRFNAAVRSVARGKTFSQFKES